MAQYYGYDNNSGGFLERLFGNMPTKKSRGCPDEDKGRHEEDPGLPEPFSRAPDTQDEHGQHIETGRRITHTAPDTKSKDKEPIGNRPGGNALFPFGKRQQEANPGGTHNAGDHGIGRPAQRPAQQAGIR